MAAKSRSSAHGPLLRDLLVEIEPWNEFAAEYKRGKPFLYVYRDSKTMSVHWTDGTLLHGWLFRNYIKESTMKEEIWSAWRRKRSTLRCGAVLCGGNNVGAAALVTPKLGEEILAIVIRHFTQALLSMDDYYMREKETAK